MPTINLNAFQACDVRGIYGETGGAEISPLLAFLIGRSLTRRVPSNESFLISGDGRTSTPALEAALLAGLQRDCIFLGADVPTPLAYLVRQLVHAHTSAIVTASHNPPAFNGIKIQSGEWPITPDELGAIRDDVRRNAAGAAYIPAPARTPDAEVLPQAWAEYGRHVAQVFPESGGLAIAVDCMHGCYSGYAPDLLKQRGFQVTALRNASRGDFGGCNPDPAMDANLTLLCDTVRAGQFAFGSAFDGDGDRVRFVDERGRPVENGTALVILARYLFAAGRANGFRKIVYDQKTRLAVVQALRAAGGAPIIEKSGHTFIRTRMLTEEALLGGEKSGHLFWGGGHLYPVPAGDCGLFGIFAMAAALQHFRQPLSVLAAEVPASPWYTGDIRGLHYAGDRDRLLAELAARVDAAHWRVSTADGVRLESDEAFAQLRASVTENGMLTAALDAIGHAELVRISDELCSLLPADAAAIAQGIRARVNILKS